MDDPAQKASALQGLEGPEHGNEDNDTIFPVIDDKENAVFAENLNEMNPLLGSNNKKGIERFGEEDHPFSANDRQANASLLSTADQPLQAC